MLEIRCRLAAGEATCGDVRGQTQIFDRLLPVVAFLEVMRQRLSHVVLLWTVYRRQSLAQPAVQRRPAGRRLAAIQHFTIERVLELVALGDVAGGQRVGVRDPQQVVPPATSPNATSSSMRSIVRCC